MAKFCKIMILKKLPYFFAKAEPDIEEKYLSRSMKYSNCLEKENNAAIYASRLLSSWSERKHLNCIKISSVDVRLNPDPIDYKAKFRSGPLIISNVNPDPHSIIRIRILFNIICENRCLHFFIFYFII